MYQSTRGRVERVGFADALISGYCSDGGMFVPTSVPRIPLDTLKTWSNLSFVELAKEIMSFFILDEEIPRKSLFDILDAAFSRFDTSNVVELRELCNGLRVLEQFHGPTRAFKDLSLVCVGPLLEFFLSRSKKHATIVVGTSGDTGGSAVEAVRGLEHLDLVVLLPLGRCTETQELQMTTAIEKNIHIFRVDGSSDELDVPIHRCFSNSEFVSKSNLVSINSFNWGRILIQTISFFFAYLKTCPTCEEELEIVVPTGGCGGVVAGCFARKMGLPIKFVCSVNRNDFLTRLIEKGVYSVEGLLIPSLASAMDIQKGYNVERLLWIFSDGDGELVRKLMNDFERTRHIQIPSHVHRKMAEVISAHRVDDAGILNAMRQCWAENQYLLCPHSATAVHYHYNCLGSSSSSVDGGSLPQRKRICFATASPSKFPEAVVAAGLCPVVDPLMKVLKTKPTRYEDMKKEDDWYDILRQCITKINNRRSNFH